MTLQIILTDKALLQSMQIEAFDLNRRCEEMKLENRRLEGGIHSFIQFFVLFCFVLFCFVLFCFVLLCFAFFFFFCFVLFLSLFFYVHRITYRSL